MLNDIATPTRLLVGVMGLTVGALLGGPVAGASPLAIGVSVVVAAAVQVVLMTGVVVWLQRADRRFLAEVERGTGEIARGAVVPQPAIGRVVRQKTVRVASWGPGRGTLPPPTGATVLTAVGDGPARRVCALVPSDLGLHHRGVPALLLLHPDRPEVAVLDDRATYDGLVRVDADPRWRTERLPTDRTVVGGYVGLLLALLVAGAAGVGVSALATAVLA
ncbi:hypothetical protein [Nocardioides litoris]|uniref:hypothetical protein n=1 Tax=Nocardioides litoris TaxID=1926648 RepID=UPI00111E3550|nr:hypothetical protein [Nocardioides litoris]